MASNLTIGLLGAGKMATALAKAWLQTGLVRADQVLASDCEETARAAFAREIGARTTGFNSDVARFASVLVLAVKPVQVFAVLSEIRDQLTERHLLISIAAGVTLSQLAQPLDEGVRLIRAMPNTAALVGAAATAFALGKSATPDDARLAQELFASVGLAFAVQESLLDAVTGLSGSGPAYVCLVIEALSDGGVAVGLPRDLATKLAAQTLLGGAKLVLETGLHPGVLKDMVTSPGGTTIEGLQQLEQGAVRAALIHAVRAATDKSRKLGQT